MTTARFITHLTHGRFALRKTFSPGTLQAIETVIGEDEKRHSGQIRLAIESALDWTELRAHIDAHHRAVDVFSHLRVWDTEENNGVLIYVLLADRQVEIIADRGIHARVGKDAWESICQRMEAHFRARRFAQGALEGIHLVGDLLAQHFPPSAHQRDELPNRPVVL